MSNEYLFTSESVSEGHPDKVSDQISDSVLDAILAVDPKGRVACETLVSTGLVVVSGEITTSAHINYREIVQDRIRRIGYTDSDIGFDYKSCAILTAINRQSPDIAQGVNEGEGLDLDQGAGDQGLMFGYACNETPAGVCLGCALMPRASSRSSTLMANRLRSTRWSFPPSTARKFPMRSFPKRSSRKSSSRCCPRNCFPATPVIWSIRPDVSWLAARTVIAV